ncbi:MAG: hypothetical protein KatS3mg005_1870 [Bryobacteraceae bacterium]|nr:MAG: hypothetical protein KatS3mg005_1870 [Bryobacteraceae bacterium]
MAYLLDANVFIEAKNRHYGFDFCPAFWDWLREGHTAGKVFSIEKVGDELESGTDELGKWASQLGRTFFLPPDASTLGSLAKVAEWVRSQAYQPAAISAFLEDADYYLVAQAHARNDILVTHEVPSDGVKRVKIPNVAIGLGIRHMNPFEMLRRERARFVLGERTQ